ncbi:hypothetical protein [Chamaesiphon sp. VAR_48_metabat_135_sub]|uniref:restriction endonuclease-related protein n=1 Tax=Chamaesiphon sp. VAR_48_metabat_135_sub TaxID=2964699 RepID=UPI00286D30E6|nr:hypothetical protein [Chamaesiphon sp. VAR_48_metabat_135_sub]
MFKLDTLTLERISAGLIQVSQHQGRLYPYPRNLQLGYDSIVLAFMMAGKPEDAPKSLPAFYGEWCEQPLGEWGLEIDPELDGEEALLFFGEPTEIAIELAEAFGGSQPSQEQSKIAAVLLQRCQAHERGAAIYTQFRRFIIEHPVLSNQELVDAKGWFGLGVGLADLLDECYEAAPSCYRFEDNFYACPYCRALTAVAHEDVIANPNCNRCPSGRRLKRKMKLPNDCLKLKRGLERFWFYPGRAEIRLYEKLVQLGLEVELYPQRDSYDLRVIFPDQEVWAIDLKDYSNPYLLVKRLGDEPIPAEPAWDVGYIVVPVERKKDRPAYLKELKSKWRWHNVRPIFDDALCDLAKKKLDGGSPMKTKRKRKAEMGEASSGIAVGENTQ